MRGICSKKYHTCVLFNTEHEIYLLSFMNKEPDRFLLSDWSGLTYQGKKKIQRKKSVRKWVLNHSFNKHSWTEVLWKIRHQGWKCVTPHL